MKVSNIISGLNSYMVEKADRRTKQKVGTPSWDFFPLKIS